MEKPYILLARGSASVLASVSLVSSAREAGCEAQGSTAGSSQA